MVFVADPAARRDALRALHAPPTSTIYRKVPGRTGDPGTASSEIVLHLYTERQTPERRKGETHGAGTVDS